jgi:hypothetical protein
VFHPTRFASPQGRLIPLTPADSVVVGTVNLLRVNMIIWQEDADLPRL